MRAIPCLTGVCKTSAGSHCHHSPGPRGGNSRFSAVRGREDPRRVDEHPPAEQLARVVEGGLVGVGHPLAGPTRQHLILPLGLDCGRGGGQGQRGGLERAGVNPVLSHSPRWSPSPRPAVPSTTPNADLVRHLPPPPSSRPPPIPFPSASPLSHLVSRIFLIPNSPSSSTPVWLPPPPSPVPILAPSATRTLSPNLPIPHPPFPPPAAVRTRAAINVFMAGPGRGSQALHQAPLRPHTGPSPFSLLPPPSSLACHALQTPAF